MPRSKLARVSLGDLQREIERRRKELPKLVAQRDELNRLIAELEGLAPAQPPAKKARRAVARRRPRRRRTGRITLNEALAQALKGKKGVTIAEATQAALALGYKTRSKNPKLLVKQALYHSDLFKRVARGLFALAE